MPSGFGRSAAILGGVFRGELNMCEAGQGRDLSACLSVYLSLYLPVCLSMSTYQSICLSVCLTVCVSVTVRTAAEGVCVVRTHAAA